MVAGLDLSIQVLGTEVLQLLHLVQDRVFVDVVGTLVRDFSQVHDFEIDCYPMSYENGVEARIEIFRMNADHIFRTVMG